LIAPGVRGMRRYTGAGCAAALLGVLSAPAGALDYQVHGYAAQGFVWSSDNRVFGNSTEGSVNYHEAGLNGSIAPLPKLIVAAQVAIRAAGVTDTDRPRLDYALADYRFIDGVDADLGVRLGKVKNPVGLFNETRDVIFTRPGILMPSAYGDEQNQRNLIFAASGVQLYGDIVRGAHQLSLTATASDDRKVSTAEKRLLLNLKYSDGSYIPFNLDILHSWNFQLMDTFDGGRWQLAYSHFYGRFHLDATYSPGLPIVGRFDASLDILSVRYNAERWSLTAEYEINPNKDYLTLGSLLLLDTYNAGDNGYVQGDLRLTPHWNAMARLDGFFRNRNDRDGTRLAATHPGADPASQFARDLTVGLNWRSGEHWGVWGELHWFHGTATLQPVENPGPLVDHWTLLMLMAAYRF
jgi:hypothetical protein